MIKYVEEEISAIDVHRKRPCSVNLVDVWQKRI